MLKEKVKSQPVMGLIEFTVVIGRIPFPVDPTNDGLSEEEEDQLAKISSKFSDAIEAAIKSVDATVGINLDLEALGLDQTKPGFKWASDIGDGYGGKK
jgi:ABC-type phosphate transport system substrate-binding protein